MGRVEDLLRSMHFLLHQPRMKKSRLAVGMTHQEYVMGIRGNLTYPALERQALPFRHFLLWARVTQRPLLVWDDSKLAKCCSKQLLQETAAGRFVWREPFPKGFGH